MFDRIPTIFLGNPCVVMLPKHGHLPTRMTEQGTRTPRKKEREGRKAGDAVLPPTRLRSQPEAAEGLLRRGPSA